MKISLILLLQTENIRLFHVFVALSLIFCAWWWRQLANG